MSRIGKLAIKIPDKVKVTAQPGLVNVEGPKGKVAQKLDREMKITSRTVRCAWSGRTIRAARASCTVCRARWSPT